MPLFFRLPDNKQKGHRWRMPDCMCALSYPLAFRLPVQTRTHRRICCHRNVLQEIDKHGLLFLKVLVFLATDKKLHKTEVQQLAEMCHMSYSNFARLFRENYGRSCKEYIKYIRLNKAQDLLLNSDYDLDYIAQETGFFDCSHFIRTYKKWRGITPKQERMQNREVL